MKKQVKPPRSIEGDWDWRRIEGGPTDNEWLVLQELVPHEHIWSFFGDGTMLSRQGDWLRYVVEYGYDPEKRTLILAGWQLDNRGERERLIRESYHVEFASPTDMYLYDREDVATGEQESIRLKLLKINTKSY